MCSLFILSMCTMSPERAVWNCPAKVHWWRAILEGTFWTCRTSGNQIRNNSLWEEDGFGSIALIACQVLDPQCCCDFPHPIPLKVNGGRDIVISKSHRLKQKVGLGWQEGYGGWHQGEWKSYNLKAPSPKQSHRPVVSNLGWILVPCKQEFLLWFML